jgi:hypothetical protein
LRRKHRTYLDTALRRLESRQRNTPNAAYYASLSSHFTYTTLNLNMLLLLSPGPKSDLNQPAQGFFLITR